MDGMEKKFVESRTCTNPGGLDFFFHTARAGSATSLRGGSLCSEPPTTERCNNYRQQTGLVTVPPPKRVWKQWPLSNVADSGHRAGGTSQMRLSIIVDVYTFSALFIAVKFVFCSRERIMMCTYIRLKCGSVHSEDVIIRIGFYLASTSICFCSWRFRQFCSPFLVGLPFLFPPLFLCKCRNKTATCYRRNCRCLLH